MAGLAAREAAKGVSETYQYLVGESAFHFTVDDGAIEPHDGPAHPRRSETISHRNAIVTNSLAGNNPDGILVDGGHIQTLIESNIAERNMDDGIDVDSASTTLTRNTANRNRDLGIEAVPAVTDGGGNLASGNGNPVQCTNVFCR